MMSRGTLAKASDPAFIETLIADCISTGLAVRRAIREAERLRGIAAVERHLSPSEMLWLVEVEASGKRHSIAFVAAQKPLREAVATLFQQYLAEVNRRIDEQLARES